MMDFIVGKSIFPQCVVERCFYAAIREDRCIKHSKVVKMTQAS